MSPSGPRGVRWLHAPDAPDRRVAGRVLRSVCPRDKRPSKAISWARIGVSERTRTRLRCWGRAKPGLQDKKQSFTSYRVCWTRGAGTRCWKRTTESKGRKSVILAAAPGSVGTYTTTWRVGGKVVAHWSFYNGQGD